MYWVIMCVYTYIYIFIYIHKCFGTLAAEVSRKTAETLVAATSKTLAAPEEYYSIV